MSSDTATTMSTSQSGPNAIPTAVAGSPPAPKHPVAFIFHFAFKASDDEQLNADEDCVIDNPMQECCSACRKSMGSSARCLSPELTCVTSWYLQVAAMVFYMLCESFNKNQFVLNFVVCIVLLAMDFWTVSTGQKSMEACRQHMHEQSIQVGRVKTQRAVCCSRDR